MRVHILERTDLEWTLVQRSPAVLGPTQTGDLLILDGELVVVRDLLVDVDGLPGVDHDLLLRLHCDDLRVTVGLKEKTRAVRPRRFQAADLNLRDVVLRCSCG